VDWQDVVDVKSPAQEIVTIRLKERVAQAARSGETPRPASADRQAPATQQANAGGAAAGNASLAAAGGAAVSGAITLAIGELTPVAPSTLPPERVEGDSASAADIGRLVEWQAYLGAALYRAGSPESATARELYQQLDSTRSEVGLLLTRAREGHPPPGQDYARVRAMLARLHEKIQSLRGA
jgi:hypothetical protein